MKLSTHHERVVTPLVHYDRWIDCTTNCGSSTGGTVDELNRVTCPACLKSVQIEILEDLRISMSDISVDLEESVKRLRITGLAEHRQLILDDLSARLRALLPLLETPVEDA